MKILTTIAISSFTLVLALALVGCSNTPSDVASKLNREAKAAGSPMRWKTETRGGQPTLTRVMIDLPRGETKADPTLKKEILQKIEQMEAVKGRGAPVLEDVRLMRDGREVWLLKNYQHGVAYILRVAASGRGGTDFEITGPEHFSRH